MTLPSQLLQRVFPLEDQLVQALDTAWTRKLKLNRGDHLVLPHQLSYDLFFIQEGLLGIYHPQKDGEEVYVGFGYAPDLIGDLVGLLAGTTSEYGIKALRASSLIALPGQVLKQLRTEYASLERCWTQMVEQALLGRIEREIDLLTPSPGDRIARLHQRSPQVFQVVPYKYLASYLRMTPETLSRNMQHIVTGNN